MMFLMNQITQKIINTIRFSCIQLFIRFVQPIMYEKIEGPAPKNCAFCIKITNIITGGLVAGMGAAGIVYMIINNFLSARFYLIFAPMFTVFFGIALIFLELKPKLIIQHFGFLKSLLGRGLFNVYLATQATFYFGSVNPDDILSWVASITLLVLGALYIALHFLAGTNYGEQLKQKIVEDNQKSEKSEKNQV